MLLRRPIIGLSAFDFIRVVRGDLFRLSEAVGGLALESWEADGGFFAFYLGVEFFCYRSDSRVDISNRVRSTVTRTDVTVEK